MDIPSLSKLTVPQLKKELKDRGLPLGGVKADLVSRLHLSLTQQQQQPQSQLQQSPLQQPQQSLLLQQQVQQQLLPQIQQLQQQIYPVQQQLMTQLPLLTTNINSISSTPTTPKTTNKVLTLELGFVDPRDKFGGLVSVNGHGDNDSIQHEGWEWGFYCTKSMDYQVWSTVYLKCLKKKGKRSLDAVIPTVEALVEFPNGKRVKGTLNPHNSHRFIVIKEANPTTLTKSFGANSKEQIPNIRVTLRTLSEVESRQAEHQQLSKRSKVETEKEKELTADWGVYGQMDSDDENRSEYDSNSDYSSESEPE